MWQTKQHPLPLCHEQKVPQADAPACLAFGPVLLHRTKHALPEVSLAPKEPATQDPLKLKGIEGPYTPKIPKDSKL